MNERIIGRKIEDYLPKNEANELRVREYKKRAGNGRFSNYSLEWYPANTGYTTARNNGEYTMCNECGVIDDEDHDEDHMVDIGEIQMLMGCVPAIGGEMVMYDSDFTDINAEEAELILSPDF